MEDQAETNNSRARKVATVVGAICGLVVGTVIVCQGLPAGIFVLLLAIVGGLVGRYYGTLQ